MPKYMMQVSYTTEGLKGLLKEGGTARRQAAEKLLTSVGGKLEALYYAFGDTDVFVVADIPDTASVTAVALTLGASGATTAKTVVLITPEEVDEAVKKSPDYRPPGR